MFISRTMVIAILIQFHHNFLSQNNNSSLVSYRFIFCFFFRRNKYHIYCSACLVKQLFQCWIVKRECGEWSHSLANIESFVNSKTENVLGMEWTVYLLVFMYMWNVGWHWNSSNQHFNHNVYQKIRNFFLRLISNETEGLR